MFNKNKVYQQHHNKLEYKAPMSVISKIEKSGAFVSSSGGKYMQVFRRVNGKVCYLGSLHNFVKKNSKMFKNKDTRDVTKGNLK